MILYIPGFDDGRLCDDKFFMIKSSAIRYAEREDFDCVWIAEFDSDAVKLHQDKIQVL